MEEKDLELGDYEVTWTLSGCDTLTARIEVKDGGVTCLSVTGGSCGSTTAPGVMVVAFTVTGYLKPSGVAQGYLTVNTRPTGATVTVDGVSCGTTPVTACALSAGSKTVTITKSGYNTETRSVTITAGQTSNLSMITLTPTGEPGEMTKSEFLTEIQNRGEIDLSKISTSSANNIWYFTGGYLRYTDPSGYKIGIVGLTARNPPTFTSDIYFWDSGWFSVSKIDKSWALARINELPFVGVAPPTGFDDWVTGKGGAAGIKGNVMVVGDIISGYLDPEHLGFSVTIFNVGTILSHYMG